MYTELIRFLTIVNEKNAADELVERVAEGAEVLAELQSIGMNEAHQAAANGWKPECAFMIADYQDYDGEGCVLYNGKRYDVIRTARKAEASELKIVVGGRVNQGVMAYAGAEQCCED